MASLYIGQFKGYGNSSEYGVFNVYFQYDASGITLSNMSLKLSKDVDGKYTTNSYYIDSIWLAGTQYSYSPTSGSAYYTSAGSGPTISISGTHASGSSVYVEVYMHRSGQNANAQKLEGYVTGLATAPTGLWCNISSYTETKVTLSGGYTSNGGSGVTSSGYQYRTENGGWTGFSNGSTTLSPNTKYYFRYYAGNVVGTSYTDGSCSVTTFDYPKPTSANNFIIGNGASVNLYNPLGRNVTLQILQVNTNTVLGTYRGTYAGIVNAEFKTQDAISRQYASISNSKSGTYYAKVTCSATGSTKTYGNYTYSIKDNGTEVPNFDASYWSYVANLTALTNNNQVIINGYSEIDFSINTAATSSYGANITGYNYKWGNQSNTTGTVTGGSGNVLEVAAIDSRGLSKSTSKTLTSGATYVPYTNPSLDYSNSYTHRTDGISAETKLTLQGNLSVMKFGTNGVDNAIYSAKYRVWDYANNRWTDENGFTIPVNSFTLQSSGYFSLNAYMIHSNGSSGGFEVGKRFGIQIILQDAQGLLGTLTSNLIPVTDGKIARDVYQDSNGDYHQGINGMGNDNYTEVIYGKENIKGDLNLEGDLYINGNKKLSETVIDKELYVGDTGKKLKDTINKNRYIKVKKTVNQGSSDTNFHLIPMNTIVCQEGNCFTFSPSGYVGITDLSIKRIKVTLTLWIERYSTSYAWYKLSMGDESSNNKTEYGNGIIPYSNTEGWTTITLVDIMDVSASKPWIYPMIMWNRVNGDNKIAAGNYGNSCYMIVEALD